MSDIKNTFSKGITLLNVKTSNFLEANKIKTYISTLNAEIESLKKEAGELAYSQWKESRNVTADRLVNTLEQISQKEEIISQQEAQLEEINRKEKEILGAQAEAQSAAAQAWAVVCPACGQGYEEPVNFCKKCGNKLK